MNPSENGSDLPLIDNRILTIEELAARLKISVSGLRKIVARNKVPHLKVGQQLRFEWGAVVTFFQRRQ